MFECIKWTFVCMMEMKWKNEKMKWECESESEWKTKKICETECKTEKTSLNNLLWKWYATTTTKKKKEYVCTMQCSKDKMVWMWPQNVKNGLLKLSNYALLECITIKWSAACPSIYASINAFSGKIPFQIRFCQRCTFCYIIQCSFTMKGQHDHELHSGHKILFSFQLNWYYK